MYHPPPRFKCDLQMRGPFQNISTRQHQKPAAPQKPFLKCAPDTKALSATAKPTSCSHTTSACRLYFRPLWFFTSIYLHLKREIFTSAVPLLMRTLCTNTHREKSTTGKYMAGCRDKTTPVGFAHQSRIKLKYIWFLVLSPHFIIRREPESLNCWERNCWTCFVILCKLWISSMPLNLTHWLFTTDSSSLSEGRK